MTIEEAIDEIRAIYPFEGGINRVKIDGTFKTVFAGVRRWLQPPAKLLDFGSGTCD